MADQEVPEEIQDYYQTERHERTGVAWLLAFGTLVVTIVLAGGIFVGGRWAYTKIAGTEEPRNPEVAQNDDKEQEQSEESATEQPEPTEQEQQSESTQGGPGSAVQGDQTENDPPATPATGDTSGDLPSTGPGSTISIFFAVTLLGYLLHRAYAKNH